ncbi:fasciclin-1 isoform X1 [Vespula maculifrons]|uniref:Fasciclin-1 isoform X1 n=1 Tax=Vespula maculifrons TaxID=7453 RepID=A0ABD2CV55_VESMC
MMIFPANLPLTIERLGLSVSSELDGNPPLWVTRKPGPTGEEEVFINNAKILKQHSNFQSKIKVNGDTKTQGSFPKRFRNINNPIPLAQTTIEILSFKVDMLLYTKTERVTTRCTLGNANADDIVLHVIDEVLEPVRSISPESPIYNPDAFQFINQSENFNMGNHRVRTFRQRIVIEKKEGIFTADGRYTFFIPVDEGFKPEPRPQKVDHLVIDGHVIPNHILFTVPTPENVYYETLVFSDNLKVTVSFLMEHNKVYVKSNTIVGDASHHTGVVLAEIVKPNIPVRNGVIHLIQRPLMVIDSTVKDFLEVSGMIV